MVSDTIFDLTVHQRLTPFSFGVCCVFTIQETGDIVQNNTYIQNPGFSTAYAKTDALTYTVKKASSGKTIRQIAYELVHSIGIFIIRCVLSSPGL